jgi:hypothetical protein
MWLQLLRYECSKKEQERKPTTCLARSPDNVTERSDLSIRGFLFQWSENQRLAWLGVQIM